jgi:hypothetical protein
MGDVTGAVDSLEELLTVSLGVRGPHHPHTLTLRGSLAHWRGRSGDSWGAAAATSELLEAQLEVFGPDHPDTLATRGKLAYWREMNDRCGESD